MLKRLDVLSAAIVCVNRSTQTSDPSISSPPSSPISSPTTSLPTSPTPSAAATDRTYLTVLFTTGVLATFALDVDENEWSVVGGFEEGEMGGGGGLLGLLGVSVLGDAIALNWEFLIGLAVIVFSALFSLQTSVLYRHMTR